MKNQESELAHFAKQLKSYTWLIHKVSVEVFDINNSQIDFEFGTGFAVRVDNDTRTRNHLHPNDLVILTCDHVLGDDDQKVKVRNFNHKSSFKARILRRNPSRDIALLVLQNAADKFASAEFVEDESISLGQALFHIGNPNWFVWSFYMGCAGYECNGAVAPSRDNTKQSKRHKPDLNKTKSHLELGDFFNKAFYRQNGDERFKYMEQLNPEVPVIQCCGMGATNGCSGGPVFNDEGKIVGMMGAEISEFNIATHVSMLRAYVNDPLY